MRKGDKNMHPVAHAVELSRAACHHAQLANTIFDEVLHLTAGCQTRASDLTNGCNPFSQRLLLLIAQW